MIKNIIFDFGDIFINLDKVGALTRALELFKVTELTPEMLQTNIDYEKGLISTEKFIDFYTTTFPHVSKKNICHIGIASHHLDGNVEGNEI